MAVIINATLAVPELTDNETWFASAASWNNYWTNIPLSIEVEGAATSLYAETAIDYANQSVVMNMQDGTQETFPTWAQFNNLLAAFLVLNNSYKNMRDELKNAGFITNSQ